MAPAAPRYAGTKAHAIDGLSPRTIGGVSVAYVAALFLIAVAGVNGPDAATFADFGATVPCAPAACNATLSATLASLTAYNQATWVTMRMERPKVYVAGAGAGATALVDPAQMYEFDLAWTLTIVLDGAADASGYNASHVTRVVCPPRSDTCLPILIMSQPWIQASSYSVSATFQSPLAKWAGLAALVPAVGMTFRQGYINAAYTTFELGYKTAFIVITCLVLAYYAMRLCAGPGNKASDGGRLAPSAQQGAIAALGALLVFFNDPFFLGYITRPSLGVAGAQAFFTATFLAALLFWFTVTFDAARLQAENGLEWDAATADPATRPGTCFWLPKAMLATVLWAAFLSAYAYVRYNQLSDPAFSISEATGAFWPWLQAFVAAMGGLYVVYVLVVLVLALRRCGSMRPSNKFAVAITLVTLVLTMVGVFTSSFFGQRTGAALLLSFYGVTSVYVWVLMLTHVPGVAPEAWARVPAVGGGAPAGAGAPAGGAGGSYASALEAAPDADAGGARVEVELFVDGSGEAAPGAPGAAGAAGAPALDRRERVRRASEGASLAAPAAGGEAAVVGASA